MVLGAIPEGSGPAEKRLASLGESLIGPAFMVRGRTVENNVGASHSVCVSMPLEISRPMTTCKYKSRPAAGRDSATVHGGGMPHPAALEKLSMLAITSVLGAGARLCFTTLAGSLRRLGKSLLADIGLES